MISGKDINFNDDTQVLTINGKKHPIGEAIAEKIGDLTETGVTGDSVAEQLTDVEERLKITKVPNNFITLEAGITIQTNGLYKQGNHIFGWITFSFSAQSPSALKLGVLSSAYAPDGFIRMSAGLGTKAWTSENIGYAIIDSDASLAVSGDNLNNIMAAHIHLDYVV